MPTTAEAGLPAFQAQAWNAIFAPKGTSPDIIAKLNASAAKALDDGTVKKRLLELGSVIPAPADRTPSAADAGEKRDRQMDAGAQTRNELSILG